MFSCVYYAQVPENSGDIVFANPFAEKFYSDTYWDNFIDIHNEYTSTEYSFTPKEKMLLIRKSTKSNKHILFQLGAHEQNTIQSSKKFAFKTFIWNVSTINLIELKNGYDF